MDKYGCHVSNTMNVTYICLCAFACLYAFIYAHTNINTPTHTDTQTERKILEQGILLADRARRNIVKVLEELVLKIVMIEVLKVLKIKY